MQGNSIGYKKRPKKRFGQNFLKDISVIEGILDTANITGEDTIIEIGPGKGVLTKELISRAAQVIAVEIDRDLAEYLRQTLGDAPNFSLIENDILKVDLDTLPIPRGPVKIVANLPYYITTPILMKLLESGMIFDKIVVMVQLEVGRRMVADPGTPDYGALSLAVSYYTDARIALKVDASCFYPRPKVDSCVVCLEKKEEALDPKSRRILFKIVKAAFAQRRKTLVNALSAGGIVSKEDLKDILTSMGFGEDVRGERLGLSDYIRLTELLEGKEVE